MANVQHLYSICSPNNCCQATVPHISCFIPYCRYLTIGFATVGPMPVGLRKRRFLATGRSLHNPWDLKLDSQATKPSVYCGGPLYSIESSRAERCLKSGMPSSLPPSPPSFSIIYGINYQRVARKMGLAAA